MSFIAFLVSINMAEAQKGLSIRGGLLHDTPQQEVFVDIEPGVGYIADIGYDFFERIGAELGVMHSTHEFRAGLRGPAVVTNKAEKTAIFIKGRFLPLKTGKYEIQLGIGPAFYSIAGDIEAEEGGIPGELGFTGWGYIAALDLKHYVTENLAVTFYLSANIVKYSKQTFNSLNISNPSRLPRGNSFSWGLTLFYRIGKLKLS